MTSLHAQLVRLAHANPTLRPYLLSLVAAREVVRMVVSPKFSIHPDLKRASRVGFAFGVSGTERQGTDYVNMSLSAPWEPALAAHLSEQWDRYVHHVEYEPGDKYVGPDDATFLRGSLLRDALKAAQVAGKRSGAQVVTLKAIITPTR